MSKQLLAIVRECNASRFVSGYNEADAVSYFLDVAKQHPDFNLSVTSNDQHSVMFVNNELPVSPSCPGYDAAVGNYPSIEFYQIFPDEYCLGAYAGIGGSVVICNADEMVTRILDISDTYVARLALFLYHTAKMFNFRFEVWFKHSSVLDLPLIKQFDLACFVAAKLPSDRMVAGNVIYDILNGGAVKAVRDVLKLHASLKQKATMVAHPQLVDIGGGYKWMPADNPHVTNKSNLKDK